jgi:Flp pilus assembly protein TadD
VKTRSVIIIVAALSAVVGVFNISRAAEHPVNPSQTLSKPDNTFTGSVGCRSCHERFYELWSTSHHGLAMQQYTDDFAAKNLTSHDKTIEIGETKYRANVKDGTVEEIRGCGTAKKYKIEQVLGGKNVYYFLTPLEKGRLQTLPLAYDVRQKEWFDTAGSAVRHFPNMSDSALDWQDRAYTFNSSCYGCHVSQLSTNYNLKSDTYHTTWTEPGINCETCHGGGLEHKKAFSQAPKDDPPEKLKLISTKGFSAEQTNTMCAPCHAKMRPITTTFKPGDRYFDHYDLTTFEHHDFYPDGRDLGENYTYTLWRMSGCAKSGELSCMHCHTSSGRYKFKTENHNNACMPCHDDIIAEAVKHTHHKKKSEASKCISCHMPKTTFARMERSDHSMFAPTPATSIKYKSPNACNNCHNDKDAAWANKWARRWYGKDYQKPFLDRAELIDSARKRDWSQLKEMLEYISGKGRDEIYATSLIRLLINCPDDRKWPAIRKSLKDPSPLVRSAAATSLLYDTASQSRDVLLGALNDEYRLVRINAAYALSLFPPAAFSTQEKQLLEKVSAEYVESLKVRQDDPILHYNLGNYYSNKNLLDKAIQSYQISSKLDPQSVLPLVNASIVYASLGKGSESEKMLQKALTAEPENAAVNFNLGLLQGEKGNFEQAKKHMRAALKTDENMAAAAYNLAVMLAGDDLDETIVWCRKAAKVEPEEPKYAYSLAYYLIKNNDPAQAVIVLDQLIVRYPNYIPDLQLRKSILK